MKGPPILAIRHATLRRYSRAHALAIRGAYGSASPLDLGIQIKDLQLDHGQAHLSAPVAARL